MPSKFAAFQIQYPKIRFKLSIGDSLGIADKLLAHDLDFAIVGAAYDSERLTSDFWLSDELKLVVPKNHPLALQKVIRVDDLRDYPMVTRTGLRTSTYFG